MIEALSYCRIKLAAGICAVFEHQRIDGGEMGEWGEAAEWDGVEAAGCCAEAWAGNIGVTTVSKSAENVLREDDNSQSDGSA
jgi:hypothetical protein